MSTILEHPTAQSLLDATEVAPNDLSPCVQRLTGWMHHITLTLLALWFLQTERLRLVEKKS